MNPGEIQISILSNLFEIAGGVRMVNDGRISQYIHTRCAVRVDEQISGHDPFARHPVYEIVGNGIIKPPDAVFLCAANQKPFIKIGAPTQASLHFFDVTITYGLDDMVGRIKTTLSIGINKLYIITGTVPTAPTQGIAQILRPHGRHP